MQEPTPLYVQRMRPGLISLSESGYCPRRISYGFRGVEATNPPGPRYRRMQQIGHEFEDATIRWMRESGEEIIDRIDGEQVELSVPTLPGVGHLDGFRKSNRWKAFDVKSQQAGWHRSSFSAGWEGWLGSLGYKASAVVRPEDGSGFLYIPAKEHAYDHGDYGAKAEHLDYYTQAEMYMHYGRRYGPSNIDIDWDTFEFVVVNRDTLAIFVEEIVYNKAFALHTERKLTNIANGEHPDRPEGYTPDKFPCKYCPFLDKCWREDA